MRIVLLTQKEFDELKDYSCSYPTGQIIGKKWKRRLNYYDESKGWYFCEYTRLIPETNEIEIGYWKIVIKGKSDRLPDYLL